MVLVGTCNRLKFLKRSLASIKNSTKLDHEVIVIDGGSTDGTIEFLTKRKDITPVFQGKLMGQGKALNAVWRKIDCKYTC